MAKPLPLSQSEMHNLNSCDREPIHILGKVQSFGCLLMVSSDWLITHASQNCGEFLEKEAETLIGTRFSELFNELPTHKLRGATQALNAPDQGVRLFAFDLFEDGRMFDISVHQCVQGFCFEFERKEGNSDSLGDLALVRSLIERVKKHSDLDAMMAEAVRALRGLTGFDRVLIYKFLPDETGETVAESCSVDMCRYMGLRFPASDIPKQARELYRRNFIRLIADVDATPSAIIPERSPEGVPPDLSMAVTRSVSPVHLEYLRNMDVAGSMSVSIIRRGELWGLFALHHRTPLYLDFEQRSAVELFVQLFNYELSERLADQEFTDASEAQALHNRVMSRISDERSLSDDFDLFAEEVWDVIDFDGIAMFTQDGYIARGTAPTEAEFMPLLRFLNTTAAGQVYSTDRLAEVYQHAEDLRDRVAGMLVLPISRQPRDYIVMFRKEIAQMVKWAGKPMKIPDGATGRLSPRKSFNAWQETVRGQCAAWTEAELHAARTLRVTLLEVVLKITDQAAQERERAQQQQELLVAELNHRVRNILNLISGVITQGRVAGSSVDEFARVLNGRIAALARAHDQLTERSWTPTSLKDLISVEGAAFGDAASERILLRGDDVLLNPEAFSCLALVSHELVTNSVKYGALSTADGTVNIDLERLADGRLELMWQETGGPAVQIPQRKGFGTSIIEHSVPFELRGEASLQFRTTGVEARLVIPSTAFMQASGDEVAADAAPRAQVREVARSGTMPLWGDVLLVEDSLVIALETEERLYALGAGHVHSVSAVNAGKRIAETHEITLAVLDVNLGSETSAGLARWLREHKIPFVLATGYGEAGDVLASYPECPVLKKPYSEEGLEAGIQMALTEGVVET